MRELLVEVGCEELPASFVEKAYNDLKDGLTSLLQEAGVLQSEGVALGTPRRLIVSFPDLKERQDDATKEQRGPALKAAYNDANEPTPALLGFCKSQGIDPAELRNDGTYVWATKKIEGRPTEEILAEILPKAIRAISFEKSMRWGSSRMRFARPIRWIVAAFDGQAIPFEVETVQSGKTSRGHRFYAPEEFEASDLRSLLEGLRQRKVEPDPSIRRTRILEEAARVADGSPDLSDELVDENVFLTEWPTAVQGSFRSDFEHLPEPVLVTAMAKHERFFPVRDSNGALTNRFVSIRNAGVDDDVRRGNEWVLNARFNDAKFFFDEDANHSLDYFLEKTTEIVFQEKLGTVRKRADRLAKLAALIAQESGGTDKEAHLAHRAGLYCKADLSTGLVSELSSLQGVIGGEYAKREGMEPAVSYALATQYSLSATRVGDDLSQRTATRVAMADQLDKLAGYLGLGLVPTGSSDPYGLRRSATLLIEAAWAWQGPLPPFDQLLQQAVETYRSQGVELNGDTVQEASRDLFASRYEALMPETRHDILQAAIASEAGPMRPRELRVSVQAMEIASNDLPFIQAATRPLNIVAAAEKKSIEVREADYNEASIDSAEGAALGQAADAMQAALVAARQSGNAAAMIAELKRLEPAINTFFDETMVMVEDEKVRGARLGLLKRVSRLLLVAGDFSRLIQEG